MKTADLTGVLLDYWVGMAFGIAPEKLKIGARLYDRVKDSFYIDESIPEKCYVSVDNGLYTEIYNPSTEWYMLKPLEKFAWNGTRLVAVIDGKDITMLGETVIIAACRAKVASVYGDEVPEMTP